MSRMNTHTVSVSFTIKVVLVLVVVIVDSSSSSSGGLSFVKEPYPQKEEIVHNVYVSRSPVGRHWASLSLYERALSTEGGDRA